MKRNMTNRKEKEVYVRVLVRSIFRLCVRVCVSVRASQCWQQCVPSADTKPLLVVVLAFTQRRVFSLLDKLTTVLCGCIGVTIISLCLPYCRIAVYYYYPSIQPNRKDQSKSWRCFWNKWALSRLCGLVGVISVRVCSSTTCLSTPHLHTNTHTFKHKVRNWTEAGVLVVILAPAPALALVWLTNWS